MCSEAFKNREEHDREHAALLEAHDRKFTGRVWYALCTDCGESFDTRELDDEGRCSKCATNHEDKLRGAAEARKEGDR